MVRHIGRDVRHHLVDALRNAAFTKFAVAALGDNPRYLQMAVGHRSYDQQMPAADVHAKVQVGSEKVRNRELEPDDIHGRWITLNGKAGTPTYDRCAPVCADDDVTTNFRTSSDLYASYSTVVFSSGQRPLVDGAERVEVEAKRVSELIRRLYERFPKLAGELDDAAVAIDGQIHNDPRYQPLQPESEVHFLARVAGG